MATATAARIAVLAFIAVEPWRAPHYSIPVRRTAIE
jgi:hypothetical protein